MSQSATPRTPSNRWTPERQLRFFDALSRTRSVSAAAACAGMSRESAYRLRSRSKVALFVLLWDRALEINHAQEVHTGPARSAMVSSRACSAIIISGKAAISLRYAPNEAR